jgi:hypothetical protein
MSITAEEIHTLEAMDDGARASKISKWADAGRIAGPELEALQKAGMLQRSMTLDKLLQDDAVEVIQQEAKVARLENNLPEPGAAADAADDAAAARAAGGGAAGAADDAAAARAAGGGAAGAADDAAAARAAGGGAAGAADDAAVGAGGGAAGAGADMSPAAAATTSNDAVDIAQTVLKKKPPATPAEVDALESLKGPLPENRSFFSFKDTDGKFSWGRATRRFMALGVAGGAAAVMYVKDDGPTCEAKCHLKEKMENPDKPGLQKWDAERQKDWEEKCKGKLESAECTTYCSEDNEEGACSNNERQARAMDLVGKAVEPELNWFESLIGVPFELMGTFFLDLLEEFAPWIGLCCLICCLLIVILAWVRSKFTSGVGMGLDILDATQATTKIDKAKILLGPKKGGGNRNYTKTYFLLLFFIFIIYYEQKT